MEAGAATCGRWDEALEFADAFIAESEKSPHYLAAGALRIRAQIKLARDEDLAAALAGSELAVDQARRNRDPQAVYPNLLFYAYALELGARLDERNRVVDEIFAHRAGGEMVVIAPAVDEVVMLQRLVGTERVRYLVDFERPSVRREAARAAAEGDFLRAADAYARHGSIYEEARARLFAAEQLVAAGRRAEADAQLERALGTFRSLGAARDIRQAEALMAAIA